MLTCAAHHHHHHHHREKDGAKSAAARREVERLPWAEEVLVMRTEMEERKQHAADLETRVRGAEGPVLPAIWCCA